MSGDAQRVAVIDIGTNSARLMVADAASDRVDRGRKTQQSHAPRPRRRPDRSSGGGDRAACEAIDDCRDLPRGEHRLGQAIATMPSATPPTGALGRRAGGAFALSARVLDGEEEAQLTYIGATSEHPRRANPGGRHRRWLHRAIVCTGAEDFLPCLLQAGVVRDTERISPRTHPLPSSSRTVDRRAGADRKRDLGRRDQTGGPRRDRGCRHPDLAGGDRDGARPIRPRASPQPRLSLPSIQRMLSRLAWPRWSSGSRSPACTPTAPLRLSPAHDPVETMSAFASMRSRSQNTTSSTETPLRRFGLRLTTAPGSGEPGTMDIPTEAADKWVKPILEPIKVGRSLLSTFQVAGKRD